MSGSPYAAALGRFKAVFPAFLAKEAYPPLVAAKDLAEVTKLLEPTAYGPEIAQAAASYRGSDLLELAINRLFVRRNRLALEAAPFVGKPVIAAFQRRWDIQNLGLLFSAKAQGRPVAETEVFLVSSRDRPAGFLAGALTLDDYRNLLALPSLEAAVAALVKFGYGATLLPLLETYQRSHDVFPLVQALEREYYQKLLEAARYFQGDEWTIRHFIQSEIDFRNVLLLLKGKAAELPVEELQTRWFEGGLWPKASVPELFAPRGIAELVQALEARFPTLPEGLGRYQEDRSLVGFEVTLLRDRAVRELRRLRTYPLSLAILFSFLLVSELERIDLRRIIYGKLYAIAADQIDTLLILPRV